MVVNTTEAPRTQSACYCVSIVPHLEVVERVVSEMDAFSYMSCMLGRPEQLCTDVALFFVEVAAGII